MCDTLCSVGDGLTLFAKNSDRPISEVQLVEAFAPRPRGDALRTQYLTLSDTGACAVLGARPDWLWGFEHGVNEHRVAIGNEKVWTRDDPAQEPPALIGMDLVRLGLERARTAHQAVDVITALLDQHGQGGIADAADDEAYFSSFLVADPHGAWVLETSARSWVAQPVERGGAISNRISLRTGYTRSSPDVPPASDWDAFRDHNAWTGLADVRLAVTHPAVTSALLPSPRDLARVMRDHGGAPGLPPPDIAPDGTGITVCMHVRDYQCTTSSIIAELSSEPRAPLRAWVAMGSPCVSVYLPVLAPSVVPGALAEPATFARFAALRRRVEVDPWDGPASDAELARIRSVLDPLEDELWGEAAALDASPPRWRRFVDQAWARVDAALTDLGV